MARSNVSVTREEAGWVLQFGAAPAPGRPGTAAPLRVKPPVAEGAVAVKELAPWPDDSADAGQGVDPQGRLVPFFPGVGVRARAATSGAVVAAPAAGDVRLASAAVAEAAIAAALDAPPAKRRRGSASPAGSGPLPSPAAPAATEPEAAVPPAAKAAAGQPALDVTARSPSPPALGATARSPSPPALGAAARSPSPPALGAHVGGAGGGLQAERGVGDERSGSLFRQQEGAEEESEAEEGVEGEGATLQDKFDTQCALCDDGGELLACDGPCMRSFHVQPDGGCNLLRLPADLAEALASPDNSETFLCPNCLAGVHQCYVCKQEGKAGQEVFKCINASCGRYYHPECAGAEAGQPFVCKLHECKACRQPGDPAAPDKAGELVPCRRCPLAFHRRCLPPDLPLYRRVGSSGARVWLADYNEEEQAWRDGVEQSLLYCLAHDLGPNNQALFLLPPLDRAGRPQRERPYGLVRPDLLRAALLHYAAQHRHLTSCRGLLAEEQARLREQERRREPSAESSDSREDEPLAARWRRHRLARAALASGNDEEDEPLAAKRRRLLKQQSVAAEAKRRLLQTAQAAAAAWAKGAPGAAQQQQQPAAAAAAAETEGAAGADESDATDDAAGAEEVSAATEDASGAAALAPADEEVEQPAAPGGAAAEEAAALTARERLEAALAALVEVPSQRQRSDRLRRLLQDAENDRGLTRDALWRATRRPFPYQQPTKKTIDEAKLQALEGSMQYAGRQHLPEQLLLQLLDAQAVQSVLRHYDDLLAVLAPYLHGPRYSSYGRHFTSPRLLARVVDRLALFLRSGDQLVDFSCGDNFFLPCAKARCLSEGVALTGRAYDVILARDATDFVLKSWFDTRPKGEGLAPPHSLCIGLNPPFGKNSSLADKFVLHAAGFRPRLMVLIVPPRTVIPTGYSVVLENGQMCGGEEFYVPGSTHRSWSKEWPVLRILLRNEYHPELAHRGDPKEFEVLSDCTAAAAAAAALQPHIFARGRR